MLWCVEISWLSELMKYNEMANEQKRETSTETETENKNNCKAGLKSHISCSTRLAHPFPAVLFFNDTTRQQQQQQQQ